MRAKGPHRRYGMLLSKSIKFSCRHSIHGWSMEVALDRLGRRSSRVKSRSTAGWCRRGVSWEPLCQEWVLASIRVNIEPRPSWRWSLNWWSWSKGCRLSSIFNANLVAIATKSSYDVLWVVLLLFLLLSLCSGLCLATCLPPSWLRPSAFIWSACKMLLQIALAWSKASAIAEVNCQVKEGQTVFSQRRQVLWQSAELARLLTS